MRFPISFRGEGPAGAGRRASVEDGAAAHVVLFGNHAIDFHACDEGLGGVFVDGQL
ncbi:hypothetical protein D3C85_1830870 [compost metagenome]